MSKGSKTKFFVPQIFSIFAIPRRVNEVVTRESQILDSRERFQVGLQRILERQPILLIERERQTFWQILFVRDQKRQESLLQPLASLATEILKMADRLSCVLNLRGQCGVL